MDWEAYDTIEPIGAYRRDYMDGQVLAMVYNLAQSVWGDKNVSHTILEAIDFIPWMPHTPKHEVGKAQTPEEMKALFVALAADQKAKKKQVEEMNLVEEKGAVNV